MTASAPAATARAPGGRFWLPAPAVWQRLAGVVVVLAVWQVVSAVWLAGSFSLPTPVSIVHRAVRDWSFVAPNLGRTATEAAFGWLYGNAFALVLAVLFMLLRPVEAVATRITLALYCLPLVAVAPVLEAVLSGDTPQIVISAQGVFFTTLVALMLGLRSADPAALAVVRAAGGGPLRQLVTVRFFAALPATFGGLRIAAPAAVLGAVVGEYLGAEKGLGVAMVYSQQSLDDTRTWGLALYATLLAAAGYLAITLVERLTCGWTRDAQRPLSEGVGAAALNSPGSPVRRAATALATGVLSVVAVLLVWKFAVDPLNPYFAKGPGDVWKYLFSGPKAHDARAELLPALGITVRDAAFGYVAGTAVATGVALAVVTWPLAEAAVMPIAVTLRAVPLVAMTPLIALVFGRGLLTVVVVAGIVTFFPSLVTIVAALRSAPNNAADLVLAFGGGPVAALVKARLPYGLPGVFAAAKVAAPTAVLGALLAEWLATGDGIGFLMLRSASRSNYNQLWSAVALVTAVAVVVYSLAGALEAAVLRARFGGRAVN